MRLNLWFNCSAIFFCGLFFCCQAKYIFGFADNYYYVIGLESVIRIGHRLKTVVVLYGYDIHFVLLTDVYVGYTHADPLLEYGNLID